MSQQGGRPTGHDDDWWGQLYDDSTEDAGPTATADSLDDRFASATGAVRPTGTGGADGTGSATGSGSTAETDPAVTADTAPAAEAVVSEHRADRLGPGARTDWWTPDGSTPTGVASPPSPGPQPSPGPPPSPGPQPSLPPPQAAAVPPPRNPPGLRVAPAPASAPRPPMPQRAPWEPPPDTPPGPTTFPPRPTTLPPGPLPAGFAEQAPTGPALTAPASPDAPSAAHPLSPPLAPTTSGSGTATPLPPTAVPTPTPTALDLPVSLPRLKDASKPYVGSGPPTYDAEPTALPPADPDDLDDLVADTVLDGARYGVCALRAVSVRGDSARYRGEPRRDALLTARFGTGEQALILVAMATGARATPRAHLAAAEACQWIGRAVGRSHVRLAEDIRAGRRGDLKSGLHRLTDRSLGRLRAGAAERGLEPDEYTATLRCLLLPADPECRTRVFFGVGAGGLFRLRGGEWQDIEPRAGEIAGEPVVGFGSLPAETPAGDRLTMDLGITTPPSPYDPPPEPPREPFRFRASVARPGDTLLMCTSGLAEPLRGEPELAAHLTARWSDPAPPGLADFLADAQVRVKGYADDRTAAAVWEA
ncbi:protein phosphatase 2C domain-containing protein [Streptomyces sp. NBC_01275]|uniref:protein phosphatase 2C domain-containing protein n=1 Tax=Streptomyces sp. NBC_01275 TaxID=2903807 RepID=UPI002256B852|nr:protein phosphatase 2C domain-containing protein [Streptomyces sp. NBC_01275]MCX4765797.1 protein phosphatase 2C domain-containing protein [Streptomyces sp. NBC_01275]